MRYVLRFLGALVAISPVLVFAQSSGDAQPDVSALDSYITAGTSTVLLVFIAKYLVQATILVAEYVMYVIDGGELGFSDWAEYGDENDPDNYDPPSG